MQELTKKNIRLITETIDRAEITFSHLREDLIDHVCCEIETELQKGLDFNKAFEKIKKNFGIKSLQQVQEKTLLLIDKNYCAMKKTMKVSGIISTTLLMLGSLFKIQHWPGSGAMLTLGFFILCFLFLPSANYVMHKERKDRSLILLFISAFLGSFGFFLGILFKIMHWPGAGVLIALGCVLLCLLFFPLLLRFLIKNAKSRREKIIHTIGVISGMAYLAGFLFKMMHWPGSGLLLVSGAFLIVVLFIPLYTHLKYAKSKRIEASFIYITSAITWFLVFTLLISITISRSILNEYINSDYKTQLEIEYFKQKNQVIYLSDKNSKTDSLCENVKSLSDNLDNYIQDLKIEIVQSLDERNSEAIINNKVKVKYIKDKTNTYAPFTILIGEQLEGKAFELSSNINETKNQLLELVNGDEITCRLIETCLNTNLPEGTPEWIKSWEILYFNHTPVIGCINALTGIQRNLQLAEYEAFNYLVNQ
ncbi:hypothetical protein ACFLTE_01280 [Bacteroidota bacterium]